MRNNLTKNRYTDVLCYDHSRVILSPEDEDPTSDYINANFVDGYKQKNAYISTQGKYLVKLLMDILNFTYKRILTIKDPCREQRPTFGGWFGSNIALLLWWQRG